MTSVLDQTRKEYGGVDPYNILVFSNHPQHYSRPGQIAPPSRVAASISQTPRVQVFHRQALIDLLNAANLYGNVPSHFPPDRNAQ